MKAYFSLFKLRAVAGLQYRAAAFAGIITQLFWGFMIIMIYQAFYANSNVVPPMSLKQLIIYTWLQQSFLAFIAYWYGDSDLFDIIKNGNVAYELCRPCKLYGFWYAKLLAQRLANGVLRCIPLMTIAFLLPEPFKMSLPPHTITLFLFVITLCLGLMVLVAISMFIYISIFITMSPRGSQLTLGLLADFLSGFAIPVPLMPAWLQQLCYIMPFRLTLDLPFRVYSGHIPPGEAIYQIGLQLVWLVVLVILGQFALSKVLKKVVVQGG